jgi:hypothetical protein
MKTNLTFSPNEEEFRLLSQIMSSRNIAEYYKVRKDVVCEYASSIGVTLSPPFEPDENEFKTLCENMSISDVAKHYGISYRQAYWYANSLKVINR